MSYVDPDELHGALTNLIDVVANKDNAPAFAAKGMDPAVFQKNLETLQDALTGAKDDRDNKKTALSVAQDAFAAKATEVYTEFSSAIDTVSGVFGKTTPKAQQVLAYRKKLNASPQTRSTPAPTPAAVTK